MNAFDFLKQSITTKQVALHYEFSPNLLYCLTLALMIVLDETGITVKGKILIYAIFYSPSLLILSFLLDTDLR